MAEKDYKALYKKALEKNRKLQKRVDELTDIIVQMSINRLSCDVEPLKGELFGRTLSFAAIDGIQYVKAMLWTTERAYAGHLRGTEMPQFYTVFFRCDNDRRPIPYWCRTMDLDFVITQENSPQFVLNPAEGQPKHLLICGDLHAWEGWTEESVSPLQIEHDNYYLAKCAESASCYMQVN